MLRSKSLSVKTPFLRPGHGIVDIGNHIWKRLIVLKSDKPARCAKPVQMMEPVAIAVHDLASSPGQLEPQTGNADA